MAAAAAVSTLPKTLRWLLGGWAEVLFYLLAVLFTAGVLKVPCNTFDLVTHWVDVARDGVKHDASAGLPGKLTLVAASCLGWILASSKMPIPGLLDESLII